MDSLLHKLFIGEIYPSEQIVPADPAYRALAREFSAERVRFEEQLPEEKIRQLAHLFDLSQQGADMEICAGFSYGFKLGAQVLCEIISGDNNPLCGRDAKQD